MAEPLQVAGVILRDKKGRYLLVQEARGLANGLWNLAAGHVDEGETPQVTALRESLEETGYKVQLVKNEPLLIDDESEEGIIKYAFLAEIVGGELIIPKEELLDIQWFTPKDVKRLYEDGKLRTVWVLNAVLKADGQ